MVGRVVHLKKDPFTVRVDRASDWGNPFRIGGGRPGTGYPMTRADVLAMHEEWMLLGGGRRLLEKRLRELEGEVLGCWCAPAGGLGVHDDLVCHGQVLLRLLGRRTGEEGRPRRRFVFSGSRGWTHGEPVRRAIAALPAGAVVVTGGARGLDAIAELEASRAGLEVEVYEADWDRFGRSAGFRRNEDMLKLPNVMGVLAFRCRGKSSGTDHTVRFAKALRLRGRVLRER